MNIINYLHAKKVHLNSSLWLYPVNSNSANMIFFLEENKVEKDATIIDSILQNLKFDRMTDV